MNRDTPQEVYQRVLMHSLCRADTKTKWPPGRLIQTNKALDISYSWQDNIKFIVVAIVSSAVSWTMVNNIMMNKSEFILSMNQCWEGDRLVVFVKAVLKECLCSMALNAG